MTTKQLSTVAEVISELGGPEAVRVLTKRGSASAVPMWKFRKQFPANTYGVLTTALEDRNAEAPSELWGQTT